MFTDKVHAKRDPKDLEPYLTLAEDYYANPDSYSQPEKKRRGLEIKKIGKKFSRIPLLNAFYDAPMGHDLNHIEKSPVDLLHTIWGGLMKNMCGYVLSIFNQIEKYSNDTRFSKILESLDKRISTFPKVYEKVPHVQWTSFPNGLVSKLLEGLSSEGVGNTGRGGGFRSAHFVPALFQIYFASESLLPVQSVKLTKIQQVLSNGNIGGVSTKTREVLIQKLENVEKTVKEAIESLLHLNFELCRIIGMINLSKT
jgi:hypothetical protein